jgi:ABC-type glycerol-3-phosphate transport system permease component
VANVQIGRSRGSTQSSRVTWTIVGNVAIQILLTVGVVVALVPFFWMVSTSLKTMPEVVLVPPTFFPERLTFENYVDVWTALPALSRFTLNSVVVSASVVVGRMISCSLVAYGFARLRFPGRDVLFLLVLSTLILPEQVTMIPQYIMYRDFGWIDTFFPLIIPPFVGNPFYIFLLRQFFLGIPRELDEAARMDGAGYFRIFSGIILPLAKPAQAAVAALSFVAGWNDFLHPLIYLTSTPMQTLAVGMRYLIVDTGTKTNQLMAIATMALLPIVIVFFTAQKYFIQGIALTGIKG